MGAIQIFSIPGLLAAIVLTSGAWWLVRAKLGRKRDLETMVTTLLPVVAIIISIWSYAAQAVSSDHQIARMDQHIGLMSRQLDVAESELRGLTRFQAEYDADWNITLRKIDGRSFDPEQMLLIPNYQLNELGQDGTPIRVLPRYVTRDGRSGAVEIRNVLDTICQTEEAVCTGGARLRRVKLEFWHDGERHRVIAIPSD